MCLTARVPVRTTPEIDAGAIVTAVETWTVKSSATSAERVLYSKREDGKKLATIPGGTDVTVVSKDDAYDRYKIKSAKYGSGWIDKDALDFDLAHVLPDTPTAIETLEPSWRIRPQVFRIYRVTRDEDKVTVAARHITYDLLGNLTTYKTTGTVGAQTALTAVLNNCLAEHDFTARTNIADTRTGIDWTRLSPINALLDEDAGFVSRWACELVRDNFEMYFLDAAGMDRGVRIEYGKNLQGISYDIDWSDIITHVLPVGKKENGTDLFMSDDGSDDLISLINHPEYPMPHIEPLDCSSFATVGKDGVTVAIARERMLTAAAEKLYNGTDDPKINLTIEFLQLGDLPEYTQYRELERLYLYDYATVMYRGIGVDESIKVSAIEYDPVRERFVGMELGTVARRLTGGHSGGGGLIWVF